MHETLITLAGWLGNDVQLRQAGGQTVASFRVASTPRRYQRKSDSWVDGDTQWYTVSAWRELAHNCGESLRRGDPVVVHGRLRLVKWTGSSGAEMTSFQIDATFVGHDLSRGTSAFKRTPRSDHAPVTDSTTDATADSTADSTTDSTTGQTGPAPAAA